MSSEVSERAQRVVLLVEDEVVLRSSMMRGLLKLPGVVVLDAGSVSEALRVVERVQPGVMICDIDLPDGSGIELLTQLDAMNRRVPTVFVSAYLPRFRQEIAQRPGVMMLEKPVALSRLREIVLQHLGRAPSQQPPPFLLTDYIQLAAMGNRSVLLEVHRDGLRLGEVVVRVGQAWHAQDAKGVGIDALMRLMHAADVTVSCTTPPDDPIPPRTLSGSGEHALLEAARRYDERQSLTPPPDDSLTEPFEPMRLSDTLFGEALAHEGETIPAPHDAPPDPAPIAPVDEPFAVLYERGVDAMLARDYPRAFELLSRASRVGTSPSLEANLKRLRALGVAT